MWRPEQLPCSQIWLGGLVPGVTGSVNILSLSISSHNFLSRRYQPIKLPTAHPVSSRLHFPFHFGDVKSKHFLLLMSLALPFFAVCLYVLFDNVGITLEILQHLLSLAFWLNFWEVFWLLKTCRAKLRSTEVLRRLLRANNVI